MDDKHPIKVATRYLLDEAARNIGGGLTGKERLVLKAINDPYKLARMMEHSRVHATAILKNGVVQKGRTLPSGPSLQAALVEAFGGTDRSLWNDSMAQNFGAYLVARRMNAEWDRFDFGQLESPPDHLMSRKAWAGALSDLETAYPQFKRAGRLLDRFVANVLEWKYQNGFLTQDQYDDYRFRDGYAPLNRVMDDQGPSSLKAKGNNKRKLMFQFKGSTRDFINPLESIVADVYATKARVELNDVIKAIDKLARSAGPNGGRIAERIPAKDMKGSTLDLAAMVDTLKTESAKILAKSQIDTWDAQGIMDELDTLFDAHASRTLFKATDTNEKGDRIVYLWEDGKRVPIMLGTDELGEDIFNIFDGVGKPSDLGALEGAVFFTQLFRAGVTKSPAYLAVNWFRDQLATWALSRDFTPFWTGMKGMNDVVKGGDIAKRYEHFAGMMGGIDAHLVDSVGSGRDVLQLRKSGFFAAPTTWQSALRSMEITEAASRLAHMEASYQRALYDGFSDEEAAFEAAYNAHDVMDFSRRGSKMMQTARLVAFLNAQMQGLSAALRTIRGERDNYVNLRDAVTPYLRAAEGSPLSVAEKEALPNSARIWIKLIAIGLIGLALKLIYRDDPEHEELSKGDMGATHWFFKIAGTWWRAPKPFELAIFSNLFEAMFDLLAKSDPTAPARFLKSIRETVLVFPDFQAMEAMGSLKNVLITGPLDAMSGKRQFDKAKDDMPARLKGLPAEMQFDAYTSEFSKMMGKMFGLSPYKTDNLIRSLLASVGRDALTASDFLLPLANVGGVLPGVSTRPRADKSFEDYIFLSRITRRSARGANSTFNFWQDMGQDSGTYTTAANGYHKQLAEFKSPRDAQALLMQMDDDHKAYALLMHHYKEQDHDLHPLHRAQQAISAMSAIRRQMVLDTFYKESTTKHGRDGEKIVVSPSTQRVVNEILEDMSMREARNAQIVMGKPGWAGRDELPNDGLWKELRASAPEVAEELQYRLTHGRNKVYSYEAVKAAWPEVKKHLLTETPGSSLAGARAGARANTPRTLSDFP
jgi:hypothetical protein